MLDPNQLDTGYAKVFGSGEVNVVLIPGWASHVHALKGVPGEWHLFAATAS